MRALITGITGFAGSHLAEHLIKTGDAVAGCSRSAVWSDDMPADIAGNIELLQWDMSTGLPPTVRARIAEFQPDWIFHLAAVSVPSDCGHRQPTTQALATNLGGTEAAIELTLSLPVRPKLCYISSCYVYAPVTEERQIVDESARIGPAGAYGETKLAAERAVQAAIESAGLRAVIARVFQHTGPRQSQPMIVPQLARQFVDGSDPVRVANLDTVLDLADVRDIVQAYRRLACNAQCGQIYNVGSGQSVRSRDIVQQLLRMFEPQRTIVESHPGHRQHPIADISKISRETGWEPAIPRDRTLLDTVEFWRNKLSNQTCDRTAMT